jgi:ATP-grasp domain-containing protein
MTVYIQYKDGNPTNVNTFAAREGFRLLGHEIVGFEASELEALPLSPDSIVCGYVGIAHRALARIGAPSPDFATLPAALAHLYGRSIRESTLGEVRAASAPLFLKPLREHKAFTGHVRRGELDDLNRTAHLADDFAVVVSDVVTFLAEWRCFLLDRECVGARPYAGSFRASPPDWSVLDAALAALGPKAPAGFAIDLGVLDDGRTVVVELNDGYSLGTYGLPPVPYAQLLEARWKELVQPR